MPTDVTVEVPGAAPTVTAPKDEEVTAPATSSGTVGAGAAVVPADTGVPSGTGLELVPATAATVAPSGVSGVSAVAPAAALAIPAASAAPSKPASAAPTYTAWDRCLRRPKPVVDAEETRRNRDYDATEQNVPLADLPSHPLFKASGIDAAMPQHSAGLSVGEAARRLAENGRNELTPPPETPEWVKFAKGFLDPFMLMLNGAGWFCILASGLGDWDRSNLTLGIVLFVVVIVTVVMNYVQGRATASVRTYRI